jgi:hypothetical protein
LLKGRVHKPFLSHQDEVALAAWVVQQAQLQLGLAITKDQLASELGRGLQNGLTHEAAPCIDKAMGGRRPCRSEMGE